MEQQSQMPSEDGIVPESSGEQGDLISDIMELFGGSGVGSGNLGSTPLLHLYVERDGHASVNGPIAGRARYLDGKYNTDYLVQLEVVIGPLVEFANRMAVEHPFAADEADDE